MILAAAAPALWPSQLIGQIPPASSWEFLGPEGGYLTTIGQNPSSGDLYAVSYGYPARIFKSTLGMSYKTFWYRWEKLNPNSSPSKKEPEQE